MNVFFCQKKAFKLNEKNLSLKLSNLTRKSPILDPLSLEAILAIAHIRLIPAFIMFALVREKAGRAYAQLGCLADIDSAFNAHS